MMFPGKAYSNAHLACTMNQSHDKCDLSRLAIKACYMYFSKILRTPTVRYNTCKTFRDIELLVVEMKVKISSNAFDSI